MEKKSDFTIIPRKCTNGRPTNKPSLEQLREDYASLPTKEVAKKYGVSQSTVRNWVFKARRGIY